jgi:hypothetical protein
MKNEITILQNMIYEIFTFYHRLILMISGREDIHLGPYIQDYINGKITDYTHIERYVRDINDFIFYMKNRAENTRNQDMGYINSRLLDPEYIKTEIVSEMSKRLSELKPNEITVSNFAKILNTIFFERNNAVFQFDPIQLIEIFFENVNEPNPHPNMDDMEIGEVNIQESDYKAELYDMFQTIFLQNPHYLKNSEPFYLEHKLIQIKNGKTSKYNPKPINRSKIEKFIYRKTDNIYLKNIRILIKFIQTERKNLKSFLLNSKNPPFPEDLYLLITQMMGIPELSRSKSKSNSDSKSNYNSNSNSKSRSNSKKKSKSNTRKLHIVNNSLLI